MGKKAERYSDIIDLPHHQSARRPHMSVYNRAAQFAPFAALTGYDQMVQDTAGMQLNDEKKVLSYDARQVLDEKLQILREYLKEHPEIEVIFYDDKAGVNGGAYRFVSGNLKKFEERPVALILEQNLKINCADILSVQGEIFTQYYEKSLIGRLLRKNVGIIDLDEEV